MLWNRRSQLILLWRAGGATWPLLDTKAQAVYPNRCWPFRKSVEAAAAIVDRSISSVAGCLKLSDRSFSPEDLARLQADIDERRAMTIKSLDAATREQGTRRAELDKALAATSAADRLVLDLEQRVAEARRAVAAAQTGLRKPPNPEGFLQKVNPFRGRAAQSELEKRWGDRQLPVPGRLRGGSESLLAVRRSRNAGQAVEAQNTGLVSLDVQRRFWDLRFSAHDAAAQGEL